MPTSPTKFFLELPPGLQEILADNAISISEELENAGIAAKVSFSIIPNSQNEIRTKDLAMLILAAGGAAIPIGIAISKILTTILRRPHIVQYYEIVTLYDEIGKVKCSADGKPFVERVLRSEIIEPASSAGEISGEVGMTSENGIVIKFSSRDN